MPPKKRDKDNETGKNSKIDHLQADHELFLQAFEKPTQIYRFLRTRNMLSPIFLNRTLSYMKRRMSRSNKSRNGFKVDSLLEKITLKKSTELQLNSLGGYMTLTFLGFYDKSLDEPRDYQVKVETLLLKICHKKRKESSSAIVEVSVGSCSVPLNPSSSEPPAMASAVSISSDTFSPSQGPNVKSYMLMLRVTVTKASANGTSSTEITNGEMDEPLTKRLKSSADLNTTPTSPTDNKWSKLYGSELIVYDKHNRCLLTNGEYDLVLHDATPGGRSATIARSPHKALMAQWETIPNENDVQSETNPFDIFKVRPLLKLKLSWSQEPTNGLVNRPKLYQQNETNGIKKENSSSKDRPQKSSTSENKNGDKHKDDGRQQIIYQFLYNNNSRQQTEACDDLHCPWCSLDCAALYSLLKHLKLCHSRFNFTYFPIPGGARIDVSINELYDGSYTGSPHDLIAAQGRGGAPIGGGGPTTTGAGGPRAGPTRRASLTHLLVWRARPRRRPVRHSLAEFLELDDADTGDAQRPYLTGHNRLYHHTITCLPVYPNELDIDSESETDPLWLQQKTMMMIDEFTDVNEGEKELMKMWNLHVMKYNYVDSKNPDSPEKFINTEDGVSSEDPSGRKNLKRIIRNDKYVPTNSKSSTISDRPTEMGSASDFNITKNTLHVVGSNPGEPKMSYQDPPYKTSKTTKNLHKVDKRKKDSNAGRMISYATVRGILKDDRCSPECTGDSSFRGDEEYTESLQYAVTYEPHGLKSPDKNVSFDTQVQIFHFTGDLCVGQSVETLSKEVDQQVRNSELRKTFMKYNEQWPKSGKRK